MNSDFDFNILDSEIAEIDIDMSEFGFDSIDIDSDMFGTDFELPSGEKAPFMQITFTLSNKQAEEINDILNFAKKTKLIEKYDNYGNNNDNGNALYVVLKEWEKQKK